MAHKKEFEKCCNALTETAKELAKTAKRLKAIDAKAEIGEAFVKSIEEKTDVLTYKALVLGATVEAAASL